MKMLRLSTVFLLLIVGIAQGKRRNRQALLFVRPRHLLVPICVGGQGLPAQIMYIDTINNANAPMEYCMLQTRV